MGDMADDFNGTNPRYDGGSMVRVSKERPQKKKAKKRRDIELNPISVNGEDDRRTRRSQGSRLMLPSSPNEPPVSLLESIIMLHGEKGVGKTSLLAQIPGSFTFMWERLRRNLRIYMEHMKSWDQFKEYVELFIKDKRFQFGIIDTIDNAYLACYRHVCQQHGIDNPDESSSSYLIWDEIAEEFGALLMVMAESGKGLAFISHTKPRPLVVKRRGLSRDDDSDETVVEYNRLEPTCKPAAFKLIQEIADFVFYYGYKDGKRAITVRSPQNVYWVACGMSEDHFLDPKGTPVETFAVPNTPQAAYQSLLDAYGNKLFDMDYIPPREPRVGKKKRRTESFIRRKKSK